MIFNWTSETTKRSQQIMLDSFEVKFLDTDASNVGLLLLFIMSTTRLEVKIFIGSTLEVYCIARQG